MNFYQFWDKLNGKPYEDGVPAPVAYNFNDYLKGISNSTPANSGQSSTYELKPLQPEDMAQASADDVAANYLKLHQGKNPCGLGKQMTDDELRDFYGHTW